MARQDLILFLQGMRNTEVIKNFVAGLDNKSLFELFDYLEFTTIEAKERWYDCYSEMIFERRTTVEQPKFTLIPYSQSEVTLTLGHQDGKFVIQTRDFDIKIPLGMGDMNATHEQVNNFIDELFVIPGVTEIFKKHGILVESKAVLCP